MAVPRTRIRLCGSVAFEIDGRRELPAGQTAELLWYLVAHRDRSAGRAELIEILWPERQPKDPQTDLRPILSRLRRALAPATVEGKARLRLALPEPVWVDVEEAARAVEAARVAAAGARWDQVREQARVALDLLGPGFLPGRHADWIEARRRDLEELRLEALEWTARSGIAFGGDALAERAARELVARSPYRESGHRSLMEVLAASGNVAEALRVYEDLRCLLRDELGVIPAPEVQALHQRLLVGAPARDHVPLPARLSPSERGRFIGREAELGALREAWSQGRRRLILLSGEPGIGKTRLTSEFALEAHAGGTVLYAGCQAEPLVSYQPFVDALRHYVASRPPVSPGPGAAELARLIPELGVAPGAEDTDPETRRYLMFEAVSWLLTEAAPLVLVLDDLHWADRPTLQLLRHVLRAQHEAALLIVGTYRDAEVGDDLSDLLADLRRERLLERLSLAGLDERGVDALIASLAGHEAPAAFVRTIHAATDGNPFFVEEVMRHLIEAGVLFEREGRWTSALTADEIGVPEGVKDVLARRLARLSGDCRATLSRAAVLGREFGFDVLRRMGESDDDALIATLEEALDAQLIVETRSEPVYAFTHALVRETLYGALSGPRRRRLHARAARALDGEQVAALALHHRLAGAEGDPGLAIDFSLQAGQRAREVFAWDDAAAHWDGALTVMERAGTPGEVRARMLVALADLQVVVGNLGRQIGYLERALALYEELGDDARAAQVHSRLGMAHSLIDSIDADHLDIGRAFHHFDTARPVLEHGEATKALGHLEVGVSTALTYGLRIDRGIATAAHAMEIAERLGDDALWTSAAEAFAWHTIVSGDLRAGFGALERAYAAADRRRRPFLAWMASNIAVQLTWGLAAPDAAQAFVDRLLALPYLRDTTYRRQIADALGRCHASRGEMDAARRMLSDAVGSWITHSLKPLLDLWDGHWDAVDALAAEVLATSRRTGNRWDEWAAQHLAARVAALRGDHARAAGLLEHALAIVVDGDARYFELWVRTDLARVRAEHGDAEEARAHLERCRAIMAPGQDWRGRAGHVELAEAVVLGSDARFETALSTLRRYRLRVDEAEALHLWGRTRARAGDSTGAAEQFAGALAIYREHGAGAVWLRRVEADVRTLR